MPFGVGKYKVYCGVRSLREGGKANLVVGNPRAPHPLYETLPYFCIIRRISLISTYSVISAYYFVGLNTLC